MQIWGTNEAFSKVFLIGNKSSIQWVIFFFCFGWVLFGFGSVPWSTTSFCTVCEVVSHASFLTPISQLLHSVFILS